MMGRRWAMRSDELLRAMLGCRGRAWRPSPNESVLQTTGPVGLPRGARLAADASVRHTTGGICLLKHPCGDTLPPARKEPRCALVSCPWRTEPLARARASSEQWAGMERLGRSLYGAAKPHFAQLDSQTHSDIEGFDDALFGAASWLKKAKQPDLAILRRSISFHRPRAIARLNHVIDEIALLASFQLLLSDFVEAEATALEQLDSK